jgi:Ni,Fe-hydrogenase I large subunit
LAHYVHIRDQKILNYQCVVPTTWNGSPRDPEGRKGPYEASLEGVPVADESRPLEIVRTIHSFDPCIACSVHTVNLDAPEKVSITRNGGC